MDENRKHKLERYLKNSCRFLWGLGPGNQSATYGWLREKGFNFNAGSYDHVTNQLLENYGIEQIIKRIVIPTVKELFPQKGIDFLRESWRAGSRPDASFLRLYGIGKPAPFLEVSPQFHHVERWGELAGIWFEEIEQTQDFWEMVK
ncbi:hypothetical protein M1O17_00700 [Dehalococcoidia bacterium]|nr:hypothetical protein [Dehalococcoidia bacterium]